MYHHVIVGDTLSETISNAFQELLSRGVHQPSRNGGTTTLYNANLVLKDPRCRHLSLNGRSSNIFQLIAETFWVMAGANAVRPYLEFFLPRAPQYSDDGETWHGAYGQRIYMYDQVNGMIEELKRDLHSRRAVLQIAMPEMDSMPAIASIYGEGHTPKDIPCNREIHAFVDAGGQFNLKLIQRSGDAIFGAGSINPFEFTFLQELMYNELKKTYPDLRLGYYTWSVTNFHLYDQTRKQAEEAVTSVQRYYSDSLRLIGPDFKNNQDFFGELLSLLSYMVTTNDLPVDSMHTDSMNEVVKVFCAYGVPVQDNLLFEYATVLVMYILNKRGVKLNNAYYMADLPFEFIKAIVDSKFRKFDVYLGKEA